LHCSCKLRVHLVDAATLGHREGQWGPHLSAVVVVLQVLLLGKVVSTAVVVLQVLLLRKEVWGSNHLLSCSNVVLVGSHLLLNLGLSVVIGIVVVAPRHCNSRRPLPTRSAVEGRLLLLLFPAIRLAIILPPVSSFLLVPGFPVLFVFGGLSPFAVGLVIALMFILLLTIYFELIISYSDVPVAVSFPAGRLKDGLSSPVDYSGSCHGVLLSLLVGHPVEGHSLGGLLRWEAVIDGDS